MNPKDSDLQKSLDLQALWIGMQPPEPVAIDAAAKEGDSMAVGAIKLQVIETPGHTQGSISLWMPSEKTLLAGDTLFCGGIGRTDLPGGDGRQILRSIRDKLLTLPEETIVIPGHGETTTIGREKQFNYFLQGLV